MAISAWNIALPVKGAAAFATSKADCLRVKNALSKNWRRRTHLQSSTDEACTIHPERPGNATAAYDPQSRFKKGFQALSGMQADARPWKRRAVVLCKKLHTREKSSRTAGRATKPFIRNVGCPLTAIS